MCGSKTTGGGVVKPRFFQASLVWRGSGHPLLPAHVTVKISKHEDHGEDVKMLIPRAPQRELACSAPHFSGLLAISRCKDEQPPSCFLSVSWSFNVSTRKKKKILIRCEAVGFLSAFCLQFYFERLCFYLMPGDLCNNNSRSFPPCFSLFGRGLVVFLLYLERMLEKRTFLFSW